MAIKIAISLTALSLIQIGMAEVWDRKGSAPNVGQDRQAHYLFIPHHCRITARWVGRGVVARLYSHIRKPLMPIRYPLAFRGTARPSVCSAWRLKVPKIEHLTHPKPSLFVELGGFVHQRETSARFCHQRKLASLFRHFLPFRFWAQLRRFCVCEKLNINICLHIPQRSGGRSRQQGQGGRGVFIKTG